MSDGIETISRLTEERAQLRPRTSVRALAEMAGLHRGTIYKLEAGQHRPDKATCCALARVFRVRPETVAAWCGGYGRRGHVRDWCTSKRTAPGAAR